MYGDGYDGGALEMMAQAAADVGAGTQDATQATMEPTRERPVARRVTRGGGMDDQWEPVAAASLGADAEPPAGQVEELQAAPAPTERVAGSGGGPEAAENGEEVNEAILKKWRGARSIVPGCLHWDVKQNWPAVLERVVVEPIALLEFRLRQAREVVSPREG